ncbi:MAG: HlyD family efflux transporter periplasmic adaptor subunit [Phycisphaerales bacterium]|nr:HlyD family efflux transporter periplasmic adaptor subunit [Phycisphaerales bacterium]
MASGTQRENEFRRVLSGLTSSGADWHGLVMGALDAAIAQTGATAAGVFTPGARDEEGGGSVDLVALRGEGARADDAWLRAAAAAIPLVLARDDSAVAPAGRGDDGAGYVILAPIALREGARAVLAVLVRGVDRVGAEEQRDCVMLASAVLTAADLRSAGEAHAGEAARLAAVMDVAGVVAGAVRFREATIALCNTLAARFGCERVTLGWVRAHQAQTIAMSHADKVVRRLPLVRDIEGAMEEALDQDEDVVFPAGAGSRTITRGAEQLSAAHGPVAVVSMPLRVSERGGVLVGAVTLERSADRAWAAAEVGALRMTLDLAAPMLLHHKRDDAWLGARMLESARRTAGAVVGPRHTIAKLAALVAVVGLAALVLIRVDHTVPASFAFSSPGQRVISVPFDAVLLEAPVMAGDEITAGRTVLARFETTDLRLEAASIRAERAAQERQATSARRGGDATTAAIHEAMVEEADARLALIDARIEGSTVLAPIDGVVLWGMPERLIGARLGQGDELYRVAPSLEAGGMLAEVRVPQRFVSTLEVGQRVRLAPAAYPDRHVEAVVERIAPAADENDPEGRFVMMARVAGAEDWMRSGMSGEARVAAGRRSLLSAWTSDLVDWVRLRLWL